jgi:hypothetical protein
MHRALGALISAMNPYSNPLCEGVDGVADRMQAFIGRPVPEGEGFAENRPLARLVSQLDVQIDNYQGGEWSFMGQMYKIKRSLLIPYRYEVRNRDGAGSGVMAIGNLLIGYTGADG